MTKLDRRHEPAPRRSNASRFAVRLPGFVTDEEIGLGDVVKRAVIVCRRAILAAGCERRSHRAQPMDDVRQQARRQGNRVSSALRAPDTHANVIAEGQSI